MLTIDRSQLFAFSMPVVELLRHNFRQPVCVEGKNLAGITIIANDHQAHLFGKDNPDELIGKPIDCFIPSNYLPAVLNNDKRVIEKQCTQLFIERGSIKSVTESVRKFLTIKTPLYNSRGTIVGSSGLVFCLKKFSLVDILEMINQLNILPSVAPTSELVMSTLDYLTAREKQCASHLLKGIRTKGIAKILGISPRTVETHLENMRSKLHCHTQAHLIEKLLTDKIY